MSIEWNWLDVLKTYCTKDNERTNGGLYDRDAGRRGLTGCDRATFSLDRDDGLAQCTTTTRDRT